MLPDSRVYRCSEFGDFVQILATKAEKEINNKKATTNTITKRILSKEFHKDFEIILQSWRKAVTLQCKVTDIV